MIIYILILAVTIISLLLYIGLSKCKDGECSSRMETDCGADSECNPGEICYYTCCVVPEAKMKVPFNLSEKPNVPVVFGCSETSYPYFHSFRITFPGQTPPIPDVDVAKHMNRLSFMKPSFQFNTSELTTMLAFNYEADKTKVFRGEYSCIPYDGDFSVRMVH